MPETATTIPHFVRDLAQAHGERTAIVLDDHRLSFNDLERRSADLARGLLELGVGKGGRVAIWMSNGPEWLVAWLAIGRIGALTVPLNTFFKESELKWALGHADIHTLLLEDDPDGHDLFSRLATAVPDLTEARMGSLRLPAVPHLRHLVTWGGPGRASAIAHANPERPVGVESTIDHALLGAVEASVHPADPLALLYTSGSTGDPKGVIHSQGGILRHSHALYRDRDLTSTDVVWSPMPFFWVGGLVFSLLGNLHAGAATLCERSFDPPKTLALFEKQRVTVAVGWPHFGKALADDPTQGQRDLSALRAGNLAGVLPESVVSPDPELRPNSLGMTETCGPHTAVPSGVLPESLRATFGTAMPGVEHRIVDPDSGEPLPPDGIGEIQVRGYSLMQGLYKREREETFEADGFYATGDMGRFDEAGVLRFHGRRGEMIKTAGANVTPGEVEALMSAVASVGHAFVVGIPDPDRGQIVAAALVPEPGERPSVGDLRQHLKDSLAAYKVPRHFFVFDRLDELPFTDSGKLDRIALARQLQGLLPTGQRGGESG
ncbi:MAG: class I adenylate-forming enzyme family protein [Myxococcota bacterium]|nr:class I adenylate-forming enzyme family protein [Myxococcota bacterium]